MYTIGYPRFTMLEEVAGYLEKTRSPLSVAVTLGFENHPALFGLRSKSPAQHSTKFHSDVENIVYHCDAPSQYMAQQRAAAKQSNAKQMDDKARDALSRKPERKMTSIESALQNFALDHFRHVSDPTKIYSWLAADATGPGGADIKLHTLSDYLITPLGMD
eukprot:1654648-Pyramimonas_sp.AAC.1